VNSIIARRRITASVTVPLLVGGLIYILWRTDSLLMFHWFDSIGIDNTIKVARGFTGIFNLPQWIIFSLPDALWVFAFTNMMIIIWNHEISRQSFFWIISAPFIGIFSEIGQALGFVPGTYDSVDLLFILIASALPFIIYIKQEGQLA